MTGHICPECGMDSRPDERQRPDGRPDGGPLGGGPGGRPGAGCACGERAAQRAAEQRRAAEQHRAARSAADSAEIAAAEDFDPLRIRPYVTLGDETPAADDEQHHRPAGDAATTMPLFLGPATAGPPPDAVEPAEVPGTTARTPHLAPAFAPAGDPVQPRRRRPFAALAAGAAVAAVVGTAAFAGGLFDGNGNGDADGEQALPSTVASAPAEETASASASASASAAPSGPASTSPSASVSASTSPSASASPSPSASAASQPATPSPSASTPHASRPASSAPPAPLAGPTLRLGDQGPAVAELQRRLEEIWLFHGRDDGDFTGQVEHAVSVYQSYKSIEGDPSGVYGPNTRRALEAETTGRGRS
ncbi:peptidoglycan-binding domain-containing protein [Streptomyces atratus]|uniref:peptidoglycan-binding domain-containing protein n=1 Tax=Streptomyces atratus TaxID=1893 RepID=UPI0038D0D0F2